MIEKILEWLNEQVGNIAKDYGFSTEWCALFVSKALIKFGHTGLTGSSIYSCTAQMNHFKNLGIWNDRTPMYNNPCIIYYDWDTSGDCDHVGFMIEKTDNAFITIEGNTMGDKWNNTSVNKLHRSIHNTTKLVRGHVYLKDIFTCNAPQPVYYGKNYVSQDSTNKCTLIQHMLNVVNNAGLTEDGIIGDNTDIAIKEFQAKYNLEIDGIVGDETLFKLVQLYFNIPLENFNF